MGAEDDGGEICRKEAIEDPADWVVVVGYK